MTVDPRDQLTPGMMRITNGEDIFEDISSLSDAEQHAIYNNMLLDPRWFKWMLQSGVKRHATPRYWQIGQLHQDKWPGAVVNVPHFVTAGAGHSLSGTSMEFSRTLDTADNGGVQIGVSDSRGLFQVGHTGRLGWMPTDGFTIGYGQNIPLLASPPEVEVMKIILPKAYKTRYYYRMFITETVYFKEPIVTFGLGYGTPEMDYRPLDVFHYPAVPTPSMPNVGQGSNIPDSLTGGNYGDR